MPLSFKERLDSGDFLITGEVAPPKGTDISQLLLDARSIGDCVDAINVTDDQRAVMRMSPIAAGKLLQDGGYEVIVQLTCRDRNRLALQSDLLGAAALGIRNLCIMTGDHPVKGDHPGTKPVYDLDSVQLLQLIMKMSEGSDLAGNKLSGIPAFTVGAVSNTDADRPMQLMKLEKKVNCGAQFIQTQAVYDVEGFARFMEAISHLDIPVLAGIIPLRSASMARFMNANIPGIQVSEQVIMRMEGAEDPVREGLIIAAETIRELKGLCRGVHLMPIKDNSSVKELLMMSNIH